MTAMLFRRKKPTKSKNIQEFVDVLYKFELENPDELCPPGTNPQLVVDCLCDVFLGTGWYIVMPVNTKQANTVILNEILRKHSKEFRKLVKEKRKECKGSHPLT